MTAPQQPGPIAGFFGSIGRYFSIVSIVPGLLLSVLIFLLVQSGAWEHQPNWARAFQRLTELSLGGALILLVTAAAFGLVLHPLQFALVQILEGYWGNSRAAGAARDHRIRRHVHRWRQLGRRASNLDKVINRHNEALKSQNWSQILPDDELAPIVAARIEAYRTLSGYPRKPRDIMPTRLGNTLRRAETLAGAAYGLSIIDFAPHLMMVAPDAQVQYVNDQRTALDLAVRCCLVCLIGAAACILFLWQWGLWLLLSIVPYGLAYMCYRGAVVVAAEYGAALRMLMDLNRFSMYERMHLDLPASTGGERTLVKHVKALSSQPVNTVVVRYKHPAPPADQTPTSATTPAG